MKNTGAGHGIKGGIVFLAVLMIGGSAGLFAAPLEAGFSAAPEPSATAQAKAAAYRDARLKVLDAAGKYEKVPYRYGGVDRNGLDCSGLISLSFRDALGVSLPRSTGGLYAWVEKIPAGEAQPGDLLFFKTDNTGKISHAAIYAGEGRFIHAASTGPVTGVIYSSMSDQYWSSRYAGAGRALPQVDMKAGIQEESHIAAGAPPDAVADNGDAIANGAIANGAIANGAAAGGPAANNAIANGAAANNPAANSAAGGTKAAASLPAAASASRTSAESGAWVPARPGRSASKESETWEDRLRFGVAIAPALNGYLEGGGSVIRGVAGQFRAGLDIQAGGIPMVLGMEIRPEYDYFMGVFRLPVTFSWGFNDKFRVFLGPAFSFGDASISTPAGNRGYVGGTNIIGTIGVSAAPFSFNVSGGDLAPYAELAWRSYASNNSSLNLGADFAASIRLSAGIRYTWKFRK